jgi:hypothetical protein
LLSYFQDLFTLPVAITALILAFVLALLGLGISYAFLRPKEVCSWVCSVHFLTVIAALLAGLLGGFGLADVTFKDTGGGSGSLITGAGIALVALAIPIWILVKSFDWVVLSNKHARRHRDLRTRQDKRVRNWTVFLVPLLLGAVLIALGVLFSSQKLTPTEEVFTLLGILWVLAMGYEILAWLRARGRRRTLKQLGSGPALDREAAAKLWTGGIGSYRIGRGETEVIHWETFTERVVITEELLLEEDREIDLVTVEEQEVRASGLILAGAAGGAGVVNGMRTGSNPHINEHRPQRQSQPGRFRQRWGLIISMAVIALIAIIIASSSGVSFNTTQGEGIVAAFLIPVLFLIFNRFRRDNERKFASEMVDKVATVQPIAVATPARPAFGAASAGAAAAPAPQAPAASTASTAQTAPPPAALRPTRPTPVVPPAPPPVILPKEPEESPTMPSVDTAAAASAAALAAGQAHVNPDIADDTLIMRPEAIAPAPVSAGDTDTAEASQALQDANYPATVGQLLAHARRKKVSRRIITWLETVETTTVFASVVAAADHYRKHRAAAAKAQDEEQTITVVPASAAAAEPVAADDEASQEAAQSLGDASYPATAGQLLEHARRKKVTRRIITWLEALEITTVFASIAVVIERYRHHRDEVKASDEEQTITIAPSAPAKGGQVVSSRISITEFQHYLKGVHYPANRARLLEQASSNGATANMVARLEELDASYEFGSVGEVMRGYVFYHYLSDASYPSTRDQLLAHARAKKASRSLILWLESVTVTTTFTTSTEAMRSFASYHLAEEEIEKEVVETTPSAEALAEAEEETLPPPSAGRRVTTSIKITDFQRYLHGIRYPVTRAQLLERAQANNAPENMIARLSELDETYTFHGVTEVMRGYVFYHYLKNIKYPANRDHLLTEARSRKATRSLLTWLENVYVTMIFTSRTEAMQSYARFKVAEAEVEEEVEEVEEEEATITLVPQAQASVDEEEDEEDEEEVEVEGQGSARVRRIRITEFQHYLKGTDYPADRAELLENARKNNASDTMIGILEELDPTYEFTGVRDVMRGYSYHRYLYGITYPTTREKLLERARENRASSSLTRWLEGLSDTASFASMGDVLKNARRS